MQVIALALTVAFDCVAPNALVILDRSGSMEDALASGERKWDVAVDAIANLTISFNDRIRFGIGTFPDGAVNCTTGALRLPVADAQGDEVAAYVTADAPNGDGTPIAASLQEISSTDPALTDTMRDNFVILVTDGQENCGGQPAPVVQQLQQQSPQVRTFVVGFGNEVDAGELNAMADAGGTAQTGAATRFYRADDRTALEVALNAIATAVTGGDPEFATCIPDNGQGSGDGVDSPGGGGSGGAGEDDVMFSQASGCGCRLPQGRVAGGLWWILLGLIALRIRRV